MNINVNSQSSATQCHQILAYLKTGQRLTSLDALNLFGCMRLASRINDLKNLKIPVCRDLIRTKSGKRVAEYYLEAYND